VARLALCSSSHAQPATSHAVVTDAAALDLDIAPRPTKVYHSEDRYVREGVRWYSTAKVRALVVIDSRLCLALGRDVHVSGAST
jgi:hypothetical protein